MAIYFQLGDSSLINHQRTFVFLVEVGEEEDEMKHEASKEHEQANPTTKKMPVWTWSCVTRLGGTSVVWETRREEGTCVPYFLFFSSLGGREEKKFGEPETCVLLYIGWKCA